MIPAFVAPSLVPAFAEIFMAVMTMLLLLIGVVTKNGDYKLVTRFSIVTLAAVVWVVCKLCGETLSTFGGGFIIDHFAALMKVLVLAGAGVAMAMSGRYLSREGILRFEYPVLIMLSTLGMMLMISANGMMSLYMGLELQSLPLYVLAAIRRDSLRATEAGLKYFILGALSSGMLLYGISLVYGFTGALSFDGIAMALAAPAPTHAGVIVGMVLIVSAMAFKISAVPFHMWAPDVYEGAPTSVTAFFALVPKVAALALLVRLFVGPFGALVAEWQQVVALLAAASMVLGAVAAIAQRNIKRMLAYSSIGHMGYALVGLAAGTQAGVEAVIVYIVIYMVATVGAFAVLLMMKQQDRMVEDITDLSGVARTHPSLAVAMGIVMFSLAGIPPLAGFFGKLFVFEAAVAQGLYVLAVVGVLSSVVGAFYYLRIVKIMYFDEPADTPIDAAEDGVLNLSLLASSVALAGFVLVPAPLLHVAQVAAASLW